jgi:NADPH:quinone reductase-like Zn-dependent oxidoreductase
MRKSESRTGIQRERLQSINLATVTRMCQAVLMSWQHVRIPRFGGPEVLELAEESTIPSPGPGEVRIKVLAAGTGFTDSFIRRGRYPDFKGPLPFTPGYELVGVVEKAGSGVASPREGQIVADLCVVGGYAQYAIRPARFLVPVPDGVDAAEAVCIPLAYLTAFQMLTRYRRFFPGEMILVIGASGTSVRRCSISRVILASRQRL